MSIADAGLKIKNTAHDIVGEWGLVAIVLLLSVASFGLGRLSALEDTRPPVAIIDAIRTQKPGALTMGGMFIASRSGNSYYYPWCTGAGKISPQNQVWFQGEEEARAAGYTPARNCRCLVAQ